MIALNHAKKSSDFIVRRFFRIFPLYWFSAILTLIVIFIGKLIYGTNTIAVLPKSFGDIFLTTTLLTSPITSLKPINGVYWTLSLEVGFYIIIYLCSFFKDIFFTLMLITVTVIACLTPVMDHGFGVILKFWPLFSVGLSVFKILHDPKVKQPLNFILLGLSLFAFYPVQQDLSFFITTIITTSLILLFHYNPLKKSIFSQLGDLSYSIYLIHTPISIYLINKFRDLPPLKENSILNIIADIVLLLTVIGLSKLTHKYIELPAIDLGKRLTSTKAIRIAKKS